jgi:hypothetical protein
MLHVQHALQPVDAAAGAAAPGGWSFPHPAVSCSGCQQGLQMPAAAALTASQQTLCCPQVLTHRQTYHPVDSPAAAAAVVVLAGSAAQSCPIEHQDPALSVLVAPLAVHAAQLAQRQLHH